jgi:hypothetical protein
LIREAMNCQPIPAVQGIEFVKPVCEPAAPHRSVPMATASGALTARAGSAGLDRSGKPDGLAVRYGAASSQGPTEEELSTLVFAHRPQSSIARPVRR